ncbi:two-component system, OmpR family, response regulator [Andreprevotia lacus DSM 23236]|jgi:DNA-binding response OmpR family regulator|uniref:Two-component system, OmpR family, response regulator n=2 Tax=Andreprevotia TaxID=397275 RepID=A0A1W1X9D8_9NEIS|nr:two-component system, OmpR family, response regulator [Andreprevotia lacus DSM 23236]
MANMRVLLVDDDADLCTMQAEYLATEGFDADAVFDGEAGVHAALTGSYAAVVLDVMMPRLGGIDALRQIRAQSQVPVIMLTAKGDGIDRIVGLELGADDYIPKPCMPRELVARLRAILRRTQGSDSHTPQHAGPLSLFPEYRRAEWNGVPLELTNSEFQLLEILVSAGGRVLTKNELCERGLGRPHTRYDRSVDVHMSNLRQKLGNYPDGRSPIQTVRGVGYRLAND